MNLPAGAEAFPSCSLDCLSSGLATAPAVAQNLKLLCANVGLEKSLAACVRLSCNYVDQQKVAGINSNLCIGQPVQSKAVLATVVFGILGTVTQVIITLRLYSRRKLALALGIGIDDYLITTASMIIFFTQVTGIIMIFAFGFGRHIFNVDPKNVAPALLLYWLNEIAYQILMPLVKSSIIFFYLRLFPDPRFRGLCYAIFTFSMMSGIIFMFTTIFQCAPIRGVFDRSIESKCIDNNTATFASSGFSIAIDFMILLMPIPQLLKLRVPRGKRNSVLILFSFGFIASVISVIRLPFIGKFGNSTDPFYDNIDPGIWTFAEMTTAVIAACLPALKPLAVKLFPRLFRKDDPTTPSPWSDADLGPRPPNAGTVSRAFNSLFSRRDNRVEGAAAPEHFATKHGKIVPLHSRFSQISIGPFPLEKREREQEQESGSEDWKQMLVDNKWPLKPASVYDSESALSSTRAVDGVWA